MRTLLRAKSRLWWLRYVCGLRAAWRGDQRECLWCILLNFRTILYQNRGILLLLGDRRTSGAPRSESEMRMIAGGNHTIIHCGLVRDDI